MHRHARRSQTSDVDERTGRAPARHAAPMAGPAELTRLIHAADGGSARRVMRELHARHGNAAVARMMVGSRPPRVNRGLAATIFADVVGEFGDWFGAGDASETDTSTPKAPTSSGTTVNVSDGPAIEVSGTLTEAAASLAGRKEAGSVTNHIADIYLEPTEGTVRIANITINDTRVLPRWTDESKAPDADQKEWRRFMGAITAHEDRHVALDQAGFAGLHKKCIGVSNETANERIDATDLAVTATNDAFDADTDHGRNTGTRIIPPATAPENVP